MKNDLISIFNRLTSTELADYNLFEDIIDNHYEKFKYSYYLIKDINLDTIDKIYCISKKNSINIVIKPLNNNIIDDLITIITKDISGYQYSNEFKISIKQSSVDIIIKINAVNNKKERDLYECRSI